jgi:hypothetical protein
MRISAANSQKLSEIAHFVNQARQTNAQAYDQSKQRNDL